MIFIDILLMVLAQSGHQALIVIRNAEDFPRRGAKASDTSERSGIVRKPPYTNYGRTRCRHKNASFRI
jgi:hypothetical protein